MKIEDIVVSLDLAKQLKEAAYPQDSLFWWCIYNIDRDIVGETEIELLSHEEVENILGDKYSAPTAEEVLEKLPREIEIGNDKFWLCIETANIIDGVSELKGYGLGYRNNIMWHRPFFEEIKITDALAKLWIWAKKEGLI